MAVGRRPLSPAWRAQPRHVARGWYPGVQRPPGGQTMRHSRPVALVAPEGRTPRRAPYQAPGRAENLCPPCAPTLHRRAVSDGTARDRTGATCTNDFVGLVGKSASSLVSVGTLRKGSTPGASTDFLVRYRLLRGTRCAARPGFIATFLHRKAVEHPHHVPPDTGVRCGMSSWIAFSGADASRGDSRRCAEASASRSAEALRCGTPAAVGGLAQHPVLVAAEHELSFEMPRALQHRERLIPQGRPPACLVLRRGDHAPRDRASYDELAFHKIGD